MTRRRRRARWRPPTTRAAGGTGPGTSTPASSPSRRPSRPTPTRYLPCLPPFSCCCYTYTYTLLPPLSLPLRCLLLPSFLLPASLHACCRVCVAARLSLPYLVHGGAVHAAASLQILVTMETQLPTAILPIRFASEARHFVAGVPISQPNDTRKRVAPYQKVWLPVSSPVCSATLLLRFGGRRERRRTRDARRRREPAKLKLFLLHSFS